MSGRIDKSNWPPARIIPNLADSQKKEPAEQRAVNVLLSVVKLVPDLRIVLLKLCGLPSGTKAHKCNTFTEVRLSDGETTEPLAIDGVISLSGRGMRHEIIYLIEAKVNMTSLKKNQIERELKAGKKIGAKALITISNDMVSNPRHTVIETDSEPDDCVRFHLSWASVRTEVELLYRSEIVKDSEQMELLSELNQFLQRKNNGIFPEMANPKGWITAYRNIRDKASVLDDDIEKIAKAWVMSRRNTSLELTKHIGHRIDVKLSPRSRANRNTEIDMVCNTVKSELALKMEFEIEKGSPPLQVKIDIRDDKMEVGVQVDKPEGVQSTTELMEYILGLFQEEKQLTHIYLHSFVRRTMLKTRLSEIRKSPNLIEEMSSENPKKFEIVKISKLPEFIKKNGKNPKSFETFCKFIDRKILEGHEKIWLKFSK